MTVISEHLSDEGNLAAHEYIPLAAPDPVLVTEQQLMLGSAVAISTPQTRYRSNPLWAFASRLHRVVTWSPDAPGRNQKHARRTPDWYSDGLMSREMYRL
jgi:hypothetical protein